VACIALVCAGFQGYLSVILGVLLLAYAVLPRWYGQQAFNKYTKSVILPMQRLIFGNDGVQGPLRSMLFGVVNGLLPCGMVYMALSLGVASGSVWQSASLMLGFGLGTLPVMTGFGAAHIFIKKQFPKFDFRPVYSWIGVFTGLLVIIRGMALEIPYLSPVLALVGLGQEITVCGQ